MNKITKILLLVTVTTVITCGYCYSENRNSPILPDRDIYVDTGKNVLMVKNANGEYEPFVIKGVNWSPASRAPKYGPKPDGRGAYVGEKFIPYQDDYGFFNDRSDYGKEILKFWLQNTIFENYVKDIPLLKEMNVNTVRIYTNLGSTLQDYRKYELEMWKVLDEFYKEEIRVICTVALTYEDILNDRYLQIVNSFKNHPAILMWAIGNEWNSSHSLSDNNIDLESFARAVHWATVSIKACDMHHPICSIIQDNTNDFSTIYDICSKVDVWGISVYRGASFGNLFNELNSVCVNNGLPAKAFFISSFGVDSYYTQHFRLYGASKNHYGDRLTEDVKGYEDQQMQASADLSLWNEIEEHLSLNNYGENCLGGLVCEFNDALWKVGNYHVGLEKFVDFFSPNHYDAYNNEGVVGMRINNESNYPNESNYIVENVEYLGVVTADREPKKVFYTLKQVWSEEAASIKAPEVTADFVYNGDSIGLKIDFILPENSKGATYKITEGKKDGTIVRINNQEWVSIGKESSIYIENLNVTNGRDYCVSVKSVDENGIEVIGYSELIKADTFPVVSYSSACYGRAYFYGKHFGDFTNNNDICFVKFVKDGVVYKTRPWYWKNTYIYCRLPETPGIYNASIINSTGKESAFCVVKVDANVIIGYLTPYVGQAGATMKLYGLNFGNSNEDSKVYLYDGYNQNRFECDIISWSNTVIEYRIPEIEKSDYYRVSVSRDYGSSARWFYIKSDLGQNVKIYYLTPYLAKKEQSITIFGDGYGMKDVNNCKAYITDSGGIQHECYITYWGNNRINIIIPNTVMNGYCNIKIVCKNGTSESKICYVRN